MKFNIVCVCICICSSVCVCLSVCVHAHVRESNSVFCCHHIQNCQVFPNHYYNPTPTHPPTYTHTQIIEQTHVHSFLVFILLTFDLALKLQWPYCPSPLLWPVSFFLFLLPPLLHCLFFDHRCSHCIMFAFILCFFTIWTLHYILEAQVFFVFSLTSSSRFSFQSTFLGRVVIFFPYKISVCLPHALDVLIRNSDSFFVWHFLTITSHFRSSSVRS